MSDTAPVPAWHREAAEGITDCNDFTIQSYAAETLAQTHYGLAAIIAAHDPHSDTVRLLGDIETWMIEEKTRETKWDCNGMTSGRNPYVSDLCRFLGQVRAHLAKLKGTP